MNLTKAIHFLKTIIFFFLATKLILADENKVSISSVSLKKNIYVSASYISSAGGATLYISGSNFSPNYEEISISIGPYPCIVSPQLTPNMVICTTSPSSNRKQYQYSLFLILKQQNIQVFYYQTFTYHTFIASFSKIYQSTTSGNYNLTTVQTDTQYNLEDERTTTSGHFKFMAIDDKICSYYLNVKEIECKIFIDQQAGQYLLKQRTIYGDTYATYHTYKTSYFTGKTYNVRIAPQIFNAPSFNNPRGGGTNGHIIKFKGFGFSANQELLGAFTCQIGFVKCSVISTEQKGITIQLPPYQNGYQRAGLLSKDPLDISDQTGGYLGSFGVRYTKYSYNYGYVLDYSYLLDSIKDFKKLIKNNSVSIIEDGYRTQISGSFYNQQSNSNSMIFYSGYFYAATSGEYLFEGLAGGKMIVAMSTYQNNTNQQNMKTILKSNRFHYFQDPYFIQNNGSNIAKLILKQGYYYLQVLIIQQYNYYYKQYQLSVSIPKTYLQGKIINPTYQIDKFLIEVAAVSYETIIVIINANIPKNQVLQFFYTSGQNITSITLNMTMIQQVSQSYFYNFGAFWQYNTTFTNKMYDSDKNIVNDSSKAANYVFNITYLQRRPENSPYIFYSNNSGVTITKASNASLPLNGTLTIRINGQLLKVYDPKIGDKSTQIRIRSFSQYFHFLVALKEVYNVQSQKQFYIIMILNRFGDLAIGFNIIYNGIMNPYQMIIDTTGVTGGVGNKIISTVQHLRSFSSERLYFQAIPYEFLRMSSDTPSIDLSFNNIPAICINCSYQYKSNFFIDLISANFKDNKQGLSLNLSSNNQSNFNLFELSDITITLYGQPCFIDQSSSKSNIQCSFSENNNIPLLPAGIDSPKVHIRQFGFVNVASSLKLTNHITISSITPSSIGFNGEVIVTITGTGFPLDKSRDSPTLSIKTTDDNPGKVVNFITITNNLLKFTFPPINPQTLSPKTSLIIIQMSYKNYIYNFTDTNLLTFDNTLDPIISGLSIRSASPVVKQNMVITGSNFHQNKTQMKVYLYFASNITRKYQLGILSVANSTSMTVFLGGGRVGSYFVRVEVIGRGMSGVSNASKFEYEIIVSSISPSQGSLGGGFIMTIIGRNFATESGATQVFIGKGIGQGGVNSICQIISINSTHIKCTAPQMISVYRSEEPMPVIVAGRITQQSFCIGNCNFTYLRNQTVFLNVFYNSLFYGIGSQVDLYANNTNFTHLNISVKVGQVTISQVTINGNRLTFNYPSLVAGTYPLRVTINGSNAYPNIQTSTNLSVYSIDRSQGSNKGQIIKLFGNGFSNTSKPNINVYYYCNGYAKLLKFYKMYNTYALVQVPSYSNTSCYIYSFGKYHYINITYNQRSQLTPFVKVNHLGNLIYSISSNQNTSINYIFAQYLDSQNKILYPYNQMTWNSSDINQSTVKFRQNYVPCGTFLINVHFYYGFADSDTNLVHHYSCGLFSNLTAPPMSISFAGNKQFTITSSGFITNNIQNNQIRVCGVRADVSFATQSALGFIVPPFVNKETNQMYGLGKQQKLNSFGTIISDTQVNANYAFDEDEQTSYFSNSTRCYIGFDFGTAFQAHLTKIRYLPQTSWGKIGRFLAGSAFKGSNDGVSWTKIFEVDARFVVSGWNSWNSLNESINYRFIQFQQTGGLSNCNLAEIQFFGILYSTIPYSSMIQCGISIVFNDASKTIKIPSAITYKLSQTPVITAISPLFGPSTGSTQLTITGINFDTTSLTVEIDGINCNILAKTANQIKCKTGIRQRPPSGGSSMTVTSANSIAILNTPPFTYIDRWSDQATWGGDPPPVEGDTVYVPAGMTLLIDQSTPILNAFIVQGGTVIFSDEDDMTFDAKYFIFINGQFRAGLQSAPYQHKLTITLHGGYYDRQLPYFGNKAIGCLNCKFNIHGKVRQPTWTELKRTVYPGENKIQLIVPVDWKIGQRIVVASTSYNPYEAQQKIIRAVAANRTLIIVTTPFVYKHFAGIQTYSGKQFIMRAEVGLLTRNIVIQGDSSSQAQNHGSHIIIMGNAASGLEASISYIETRNCGQPKIIGRYCTHFHNTGDVPNSFVRGISVHHSLARVLSIWGTNYLLVQKNVGYYVKGHNIITESGTQTHNIIQDNLMINSITSPSMLQSDISVASYWISNPSNTIRRNHAAGSDYQGFRYQIEPNPVALNSYSINCPTGMPLYQSSNNVAHSNIRFGLRIFNYSARTFPCQPTFDQSLINPFLSNPALQSIFSNYLLWKNKQNGLLAEHLGFATFNNFFIIDSGRSGMQFCTTNWTIENVKAQNSIVVGYSLGNAVNNTNQLRNVRGLITPRTDGFKAQNIAFINFRAVMTPLQSCSKCQNPALSVVGGKTSFFKNITYQNIEGNYIYWNNWRRQIFIDEDGSLTRPIALSLATNINRAATITPYFEHFNFSTHCYRISSLWDDSSFCDSTIKIRALLYTNVDPYWYTGMQTSTNRLVQQNNFTIIPYYSYQFIYGYSDIPFSWVYPYIIGQYYQFAFYYQDFTHLSLGPNQYWGQNESIVIKFSYYDQRQLFDIGHYYQQRTQLPLIIPIIISYSTIISKRYVESLLLHNHYNFHFEQIYLIRHC